jgi:hypothetical protein
MDHIADLRGYDHILFIIALCARYVPADWKKVLVLVTAFTVGHSLTLAASALNAIDAPTKWIEFLIPVTIILTAIANLFERKFEFRTRFPPIYFMALFFGLIHGLGFSTYLKSLMGKDSNIITELLAFNLGLEAGQLLIVLAIMIVSLTCTRFFNINRRAYLLFVSGIVAGMALIMAIQRLPF